MASKGVSQIDFAIAAGMFILLFATIIVFVSGYFQNIRNDATITERQGLALGLANDLMSEGYPENWDAIIQTFSVNNASNWSRSLVRATNATISIFSSGQLSLVDGASAIIDGSAGADALEAVFPSMSIPENAVLGGISVKAYYNTSLLETSYGDGDYVDDMTFFSGPAEIYMEDWGSGSTSGAFIWWNSSEMVYEVENVSLANSFMIRLYYNPSETGICYFDQINASANYSFYPFYPSKMGLSAESYSFEVILNNTIGDITPEKVIINLSEIGFPDADNNSVVVYNESGSLVPCSISGKILSFESYISNNTAKWYRVWFSRNSTSNFSSPYCSASVSGTNNLTTANRNETIYPYRSSLVMQYRKLDAMNRSEYDIMKGVTGSAYDFHITIRDLAGTAVYDYGSGIPRKGDISSFRKKVLYQNSTSGIEEGYIYVYLW